MDYFFTRDDEYLSKCPENLTFSYLHFCSEKKFREWTISVSKRIKTTWTRKGVPVLLGNSTPQDIVEDMRKLSLADTDKLSLIDDLTDKPDCLASWSREGVSVNNFFPTMWMTTDASVNISLCDALTAKTNETSRYKSFRRHFRRDGFYTFSKHATRSKDLDDIGITTGKKWLEENEKNKKRQAKYLHNDYWFEYQKNKSNNKGKLTITKKEIGELVKKKVLKQKHIRSIEVRDKKGNTTHRYDDLKNNTRFYIRVFDSKEKVFTTKSIKIFRMGFSVIPATNFPPVLAKHIYKRYTEKRKKQKRIVIFDPSSGWGGRILGACAAGSDRNIHYVGTDPNKDNFIGELGISRYEYVADFYQRNVPQENHITYEMFDSGSEEIHKDPKFRKYKGKIDVVFTSPPYFDAEGYSQDETQSSIKFPEYGLWRDNFLRKTLDTACRYLRVGGYLIWNIADMKKGPSMLPLENDTIEILTSLGMKYEDKLKYVLATAPGGGRVSWVHRMPQTKNFVSVGGKYRKYEPMFVFRKVKEIPK